MLLLSLIALNWSKGFNMRVGGTELFDLLGKHTQPHNIIHKFAHCKLKIKQLRRVTLFSITLGFNRRKINVFF